MIKRSTRVRSWAMVLLALVSTMLMSGCAEKGIVLEIKATEDRGRNGMFLVCEPLFYDSQGNSINFTKEQKTKIKYNIYIEGKGFPGLIKNAQNTFDAYKAFNIIVATGPTFAESPTLGSIKLLMDVSIPIPTPGDVVVGVMKSIQNTKQIITQGLLKYRCIPIGWGDKLEIFYPEELFGSNPSKVTVGYVFQDYEMINSTEVTATNIPGKGTEGPGPLRQILKTVMRQCGAGIMESGLFDDDFRYLFFGEVLSNCPARVNPPFNEILRSATCEGSTNVPILEKGETRVIVELQDCHEKRGTITGRVIDASSSSAISGARITTTNPTISPVTTDASGSYTISDVKAGTYTVTAMKDGYNDNSINITLSLGETRIAEFVLSPKGGIAGLIAYYPFNGNTNDESGNRHHGEGHGTELISDRFDKPNSAYHFDGSSFITIPSSAINDLRQGTVVAWIKLDALNRQNCILDKTTTYVVNDFQLMVDSNNRLRCYLDARSGGPPCDLFFSTTPLTAKEWHQIAVTWDGSSCKYYLDGREDGHGRCCGGGTVPRTDRQPYIGKVDNNSAFMRGDIDDIRIYDRPLTDNEIRTLYRERGWQ